MRGISFFIAGAFSLVSVSLYPVLRGEFVIHHYPPWSVAQSAVYILGGVLLQVWFCIGRRNPSVFMLLAQVVTGILYVAGIVAFPGDVYHT